MAYLFAFVILLAIVWIGWRLTYGSSSATPSAVRHDAPRGPDDDPEFLDKL
ncbi:MAG: hypothetical protein QM774_13130 [Gordonia sp. (in: high G+C Gram-positive bacteria)]|uniref:hypothetical protein n=1 Tax=Gordonia sp. (in: high G+C Gram-positive bacteria) TaxID=84139 RepID=UPI0039E412A4